MVIKNCKRSLSLLLSLVLIMGMIPVAVFSASADDTTATNNNPFTQDGTLTGNTVYDPFTTEVGKTTPSTNRGSASNPFEITQVNDLKVLATIVNEGIDSSARTGVTSEKYKQAPFDCAGYYFKVKEDIDITDDFTNSIGSYDTAPFNGTFDVGTVTKEVEGKTTTRLAQIDISEAMTSLFGYIGKKGTVKNVVVTGKNEEASNFGGVACQNAGIVENCTNEADITATGGYVAGIVVNNSGKVLNCKNKGNIIIQAEEAYYFAGIVAINTGVVTGCENNGRIYTNNTDGDEGEGNQGIAGIVAYNAGIITSCKNNKVSEDKYKYDTGEDNAKGEDIFAYNSADIENALINGGAVENNGTKYLGGIVGRNVGILKDCSNNGNIINGESAKSTCFGGIVGLSVDGYMLNCTNSGAVKNSGDKSNCFGGIVGCGLGDTIKDCANKGAISNTGDDKGDYICGAFGGIVGKILRNGEDFGDEEFYSETGTTTIKDCINEGTITNEGDTAGSFGGIVGKVNETKSVKVKNCTNNAPVTNKEDGKWAGYFGGIIGDNLGAEVKNCKNTGKITNEAESIECFGGIVGNMQAGTVTACENTGDISSAGDYVSSIGGIAGSSMGSIEKCKNSGNISSEGNTGYQIGGIAGACSDVKDCTNSGTVSSKGDEFQYIGGIAGGTLDGCITGCTNDGTVNSKGDNCGSIGGILGSISEDGSMDSCISNGDVNSDGKQCKNIGGLVGGNRGLVINSINNATVTATGEYVYNVGGLVGENEETGEVVNSVNNKAVSANGGESSDVGGLIGKNSGIVKNSVSYGAVDATCEFAGGVIGENDTYEVEDVDNCYYDSTVCELKKAIGNQKEEQEYSKTVKGLSTDECKQTAGDDALITILNNFVEGEGGYWYPNEGSSGDYYDYDHKLQDWVIKSGDESGYPTLGEKPDPTPIEAVSVNVNVATPVIGEILPEEATVSTSTGNVTAEFDSIEWTGDSVFAECNHAYKATVDLSLYAADGYKFNEDTKLTVTINGKVVEKDSCWDTKVSYTFDKLDHSWVSEGKTQDNKELFTCKYCDQQKYKLVKVTNPTTPTNNDANAKVKTTKSKQTIKLTKNTVNANKKIKATAKGKLSFKKTKGNKKIAVNSAGKVTVKKGLKAGKYTIKVKITAKATAKYKKATATKKITVKVK